MVTVARDTAARILHLGKAKSAEMVYADTYNTEMSQIIDQVRHGYLDGALEITRMILGANEVQQPHLRVPGEIRKLLAKLEHSLRVAAGP